MPSPAAVARHLLSQQPVRNVVGHCNLRAHVAPNVFALWERWEAETGSAQPPPFWAVVWPGAALMASWLLAHPECVRGKRVLDIGCGSAVAAVAAAKAGAALSIANDLDSAALAAAELTAALNGVTIRTCGADLTASLDSALAAEVVLVCEMFYEAGPAQRMVQWLERQRARGASVWIADGERGFLPKRQLRRVQTRPMNTDVELEGAPQRIVSLYTWS